MCHSTVPPLPFITSMPFSCGKNPCMDERSKLDEPQFGMHQHLQARGTHALECLTGRTHAHPTGAPGLSGTLLTRAAVVLGDFPMVAARGYRARRWSELMLCLGDSSMVANTSTSHGNRLLLDWLGRTCNPQEGHRLPQQCVQSSLKECSTQESHLQPLTCNLHHHCGRR
jgi:hypothetical protein